MFILYGELLTMRLIRPSFEVMGNICAIEMLKNIESSGRVCYKSEGKNAEGDFELTKKFVKGIIARGHESVLEHEKLTIKFIVDRGISHELVRHRIASFSQESTRYCNYGNDHITFILPYWVTIPEGIYEHEQSIHDIISRDCGAKIWALSMLDSEFNYNSLLHSGRQNPEQARSVLPNSLKTEIVVTANLREWRHIFNLRAIGTTGRPHPDMVEVMKPCMEYVKELIPVVFDDLKMS